MATKYYEGQSAFREGLEAIDSPSPAGQKLRAEVGEKLVAHLRRMFQTIGLQIGYAYPDSPICVSDGTPPPVDDPGNYQPSTWPGARAPHVLLADGRSTLDLFGKGFVLLRLGSEPPVTSDIEARARERGVPLTTIAIQDAKLAKVYETPLVLVRLDGHVAWRGKALPVDPRALVDHVCGAQHAG